LAQIKSAAGGDGYLGGGVYLRVAALRQLHFCDDEIRQILIGNNSQSDGCRSH